MKQPAWRVVDNQHIVTMFIMPQKIRDLIKVLEKAGFINRGGKGSHRNFVHPKGIAITLSGKIGDDAKLYQKNAKKETLFKNC